MLTGQPRFGGVLLPYMDLDAWCEVSWRDESVVAQTRAGTLVREVRHRLVGRGGWRALSYADLKQIHGLLAAGPVEVTPRTRRGPSADHPGDPAVAELLAVCRVTSDLAETTPVARRDAGTGRLLYSLDVEFEALATVGQIPGALYGGLVLHGEDEQSVEVEPWGVAALVEHPLVVQFDGQDYALTALELTPADIADLILLDVPGDPDSIEIDAINDFQAPAPGDGTSPA